MMKMIITDVDTVSQIIHNEFSSGESAAIDIDAAPALVQEYVNFKETDKKCKNCLQS